MPPNKQWLSPIFVDFSDDLEEKVINKILSVKEGFSVYFVIRDGERDGTSQKALFMYGFRDNKGIFAKVPTSEGNDSPVVGRSDSYNIPLAWRSPGNGGTLSFCSGKGATVGDFVSDVMERLDKENGILDFGMYLSLISNDMTRRNLVEFFEKYSQSEASQKWLAEMERIGRCNGGISNFQNCLKNRRIPFSNVQSFLERYGRPPFPTTLLSDRTDLVEDELHTMRLLVFHVFGRELPFLVPVSLSPEDETLTLSRLFVKMDTNKTHEKSQNVCLFAGVEYRKGAVKENYEIPYEGPDLTSSSVLSFCREQSFERYLEYNSFYEGEAKRGITAEYLVTNGALNLREQERSVIRECLKQFFGVPHSVEKTNQIVDQKNHVFVVLKTEKGRYVLSDNGNVLVGRYILGGIKSLEKTRILDFLKNEKTAGKFLGDNDHSEER